MKSLLVLASLFTLSISAMENNQPSPGDEAIQNHPHAWMATKLGGGLTGSVVGLSTFALIAAASDAFDTVVSQGPAKRLKLFKALAIGIPVTYGSWKGGQALSEAAWYSVWTGVDKAKKIYDITSK